MVNNILHKNRAELPRNEEAKKLKFSVSYCSQLNISQCEVTDRTGDSFVVNVYNPLGKYINNYVRVPVGQEYNELFYNYSVIDSNGKKIRFYNNFLNIITNSL